MRVFISHLLNENDINIFEIIETRHFDRLQATSVIGEVHLHNFINELLLFLFIFFIFHKGIHGRKNKNCSFHTSLKPCKSHEPVKTFRAFCPSLILLHFTEFWSHFLNIWHQKDRRAKALSVWSVKVLRADVCKYRPEMGKIKFLENPPKNYVDYPRYIMKI